jgi:hypothetical protein
VNNPLFVCIQNNTWDVIKGQGHLAYHQANQLFLVISTTSDTPDLIAQPITVFVKDTAWFQGWVVKVLWQPMNDGFWGALTVSALWPLQQQSQYRAFVHQTVTEIARAFWQPYVADIACVWQGVENTTRVSWSVWENQTDAESWAQFAKQTGLSWFCMGKTCVIAQKLPQVEAGLTLPIAHGLDGQWEPVLTEWRVGEDTLGKIAYATTNDLRIKVGMPLVIQGETWLVEQLFLDWCYPGWRGNHLVLRAPNMKRLLPVWQHVPTGLWQGVNGNPGECESVWGNSPSLKRLQPFQGLNFGVSFPWERDGHIAFLWPLGADMPRVLGTLPSEAHPLPLTAETPYQQCICTREGNAILLDNTPNKEKIEWYTPHQAQICQMVTQNNQTYLYWTANQENIHLSSKDILRIQAKKWLMKTDIYTLRTVLLKQNISAQEWNVSCHSLNVEKGEMVAKVAHWTFQKSWKITAEKIHWRTEQWSGKFQSIYYIGNVLKWQMSTSMVLSSENSILKINSNALSLVGATIRMLSPKIVVSGQLG